MITEAFTKISFFSGHPYSASTQISKIEGCELKRQSGSLPFLFKNGACGTYSNKVFLCFGESSKSQCHRLVLILVRSWTVRVLWTNWLNFIPVGKEIASSMKAILFFLIISLDCLIWMDLHSLWVITQKHGEVTQKFWIWLLVNGQPENPILIRIG